MCVCLLVLVNDNEWTEIWRRLREAETHQESQATSRKLIFAFSARVQPTQQTKHGNEVTQGLKHQNSGFSSYSRKPSHWF